MFSMLRVLMVVVLACVVAACGRQRLATRPDVPPLAAPAPPPRVVAPPQPEDVPPPEKSAEEPVRKPARPAARTETREVPKVEPQQPPQPVTPPPVTEPQPAADTLQTAKPGEQKQLEGQVTQLLARASGDLNKTDYRKLSADAKGQYDTAKRFIDQAGQALRDRNLVLAQKLADKAATIAALLVGR
jgi:hypothetical protein